MTIEMKTLTEIEALNVTEFDEYIEDKFGNPLLFEHFLLPTLVRRTIDYLLDLRDSLDGQIERHGNSDDTDENWVARTRGLRGIVSSRLARAQRRQGAIETRERREEGAESRHLSEVKRFAHMLCEALDSYEEANLELDRIIFPLGDHKMTARQWLARRLEKEPARTGVNA